MSDYTITINGQNDILEKEYSYKLVKMTEPVSVIVTIYNKAKYLDACLSSILNQSYTNLDIILLEDASTDESLEIAQKYAQKDSRIRLISDGVNHGVSYARNRGIELATSEYITFVDGDDILDVNAIEKMLHAFYEYIIDWAVFGIRTRTDGKDKVYSRASQSKFYLTHDPQFFQSLYLGKQIYSCCAKMYRKSKIKVNFEDYMIEDMLFNVKYMEHIDKAFLSSDIVYTYIKTDDEMSRSRITSRDNIGNYKAVSDEMADVVQRLYPNDKKALYLASGFVLAAMYANFALLYRAKASKEEIFVKMEQDINDARIQQAMAHMMPTSESEQEFQENLQNKNLESLYSNFVETYEQTEEIYESGEGNKPVEIMENYSLIVGY